MTIPTLSLAPMLAACDRQFLSTHDLGAVHREAAPFVAALGNALQTFGFVIIRDHGIPHELLAATRASFVEYFDLAPEAKARYDQRRGGQRGHTPIGRERAVGAEVGDLKEFYHIGPEHPPLLSRMPGANVWPLEVPKLKNDARALHAAMAYVACVLLRAIGLYLQLKEPDHFCNALDKGENILRAIHYPPIAADMTPGALRAAAHEDINLITLLPEASEPGLEIQLRDGSWLAVNAQPGELIVDVGDMLQRATNGLLPSTRHRVVNPPGAANVSRYSLPFFAHPYADFSLAPPEGGLVVTSPLKYPVITAGEYLTERLTALGLMQEAL